MFADLKHDDRPHRFGWAPGSYTCKCGDCGAQFIGEKRAFMCADCAYALTDEEAARRRERNLSALTSRVGWTGRIELTGNDELKFYLTQNRETRRVEMIAQRGPREFKIDMTAEQARALADLLHLATK